MFIDSVLQVIVNGCLEFLSFSIDYIFSIMVSFFLKLAQVLGFYLAVVLGNIFVFDCFHFQFKLILNFT